MPGNGSPFSPSLPHSVAPANNNHAVGINPGHTAGTTQQQGLLLVQTPHTATIDPSGGGGGSVPSLTTKDFEDMLDLWAQGLADMSMSVAPSVSVHNHATPVEASPLSALHSSASNHSLDHLALFGSHHVRATGVAAAAQPQVWQRGEIADSRAQTYVCGMRQFTHTRVCMRAHA